MDALQLHQKRNRNDRLGSRQLTWIQGMQCEGGAAGWIQNDSELCLHCFFFRSVALENLLSQLQWYLSFVANPNLMQYWLLS